MSTSMKDFILNKNRSPAGVAPLGDDAMDDDEEGDTSSPYGSIARPGADVQPINPGASAEDDENAASGTAPAPKGYAPPPAPADTTLADYDAGEKKLADVRGQTQDRNSNINAFRALATLAGAGSGMKADDSLYDSLAKNNSDQGAQAAADLTRRAGVIKAIQAAKVRQAIAQQGVTAAKDRQDANLNSREKIAREKIAAITANTQAVQGTRQDANADKAYNQTVQQLETMRGNPAAAQAEKDIYAAQKIATLIKTAAPDGDLNKMSDAQSKLMIMEVAKMASGGQASEAELASLDPHAVQGRFAKAWSEYANDPTPAKAGSFLKQYKDYADGLAKDAQDEITGRYGRLIGAKKAQLSDDQQQSLQDLYVNRFKTRESASVPAPAPAVAQAQGLTPEQQKRLMELRAKAGR